MKFCLWSAATLTLLGTARASYWDDGASVPSAVSTMGSRHHEERHVVESERFSFHEEGAFYHREPIAATMNDKSITSDNGAEFKGVRHEVNKSGNVQSDAENLAVSTIPTPNIKEVKHLADADTLGPKFTVDVLRYGDRVTAEVSMGHAIEVAYYGAMYKQEYDGFYYFDEPSKIQIEMGKVRLCDMEGKQKVDIHSEKRVQLANCTTICPTTSTTSCAEKPLFEFVALETILSQGTGLSGLEDGTKSIVPTFYEYGLYHDAPGTTPSNFVSEFKWDRPKENQQAQYEDGDFYISGFLAPNRTCTNRRELILKRIDLTGTVSTQDCVTTDSLDNTSPSSSVHFKIGACGHQTNDPNSPCEQKTLGPFGYNFLIENISNKGNDDLLCRFEKPNEFCLMTLGSEKLQVNSWAKFVSTPAAYTNVYETLSCIYRESRSNTRYLPAVDTRDF